MRSKAFKYYLLAKVSSGDRKSRYERKYSIAANQREEKTLLNFFYEKTLVNNTEKHRILRIPIYVKRKYDNFVEKRFFGINIGKRQGYGALSRAYLDWIVDSNKNPKKHFVEDSKHVYEREENDTKVIAYYLPQYYRIDVNDKFHGKGFTEWTNSSKTMPMFTGHEQPHIPYDVGYYDLLNIETFKRQIQLARRYGIYGFCFHWYWFSGDRTMEKPMEILLSHPELEINYCINWATENWTALWDGGNRELIFKQDLKEGDATRFFYDIYPYIKDKRYIKIDGKPLLSIYSTKVFANRKNDFINFISELRKLAKDHGFPGLYILITNSFYFNENVEEWGADAISEFPPSFVDCEDITSRWPKEEVNQYFQGSVVDFAKFVNQKKYLYVKYKSKVFYRSAMAGWDNTARKAFQNACKVHYGATPELFKQWLIDIIAESKRVHDKENDICFVNSWNEWAEGSHLEPCLRYGYGYLQAVKEAIEINRPIRTDLIERRVLKQGKDRQIQIVVNCIESLGDVIATEPISRYIKNKYTNCKLTWIVKDIYSDVVKYNKCIDEVITVKDLIEADKLLYGEMNRPGTVIVDTHYDGRRCNNNYIHKNPNNPCINEKTYFNYGSVLATFCLSSGLPPLKDEPKFHLDPELSVVNLGLPERYIVVHCKSAESVKDWSADKWQLLIDKLLKENIAVVEIGISKTIRSKNSNYFDFTGKRSIQLVSKIIEKAEYFIGIDSCFAHVANCFDVFAFLLMGKYKTFDQYNPYSGKYGREENCEIIRANEGEEVCTIDVNKVFSIIKNKIK